MAKTPVVTEENPTNNLEDLTSQFEKFKTDVTKGLEVAFNTNIDTLTKRCEAMEVAIDSNAKATNILESDVRSIGGKGLSEKDKPATDTGKKNKTKFAFNLLDLASKE